MPRYVWANLWLTEQSLEPSLSMLFKNGCVLEEIVPLPQRSKLSFSQKKKIWTDSLLITALVDMGFINLLLREWAIFALKSEQQDFNKFNFTN